jgi:hypothetical protein
MARAELGISPCIRSHVDGSCTSPQLCLTCNLTRDLASYGPLLAAIPFLLQLLHYSPVLGWKLLDRLVYGHNETGSSPCRSSLKRM